MANATRKTIEKTVTEDLIVLELTQEEADWLNGIISFETDDEAKSIFAALRAPTETDDRPIQVGDKVRILKSGWNPAYNERIGRVGKIDDEDSIGRYRVEFLDGDYDWATTVERVSD